MYAVGDIDNFDAKLKPLAQKLVKENPRASWWILGDAGYGNRSQVTEAYRKLASVLQPTQHFMVFGDHDYGTQTPSEFTHANLVTTGASKILNAQDTPAYFITQSGVITPALSDAKNAAWAITGTNDICVEAETSDADCHPSQFTDFNNALSSANKTTTCSIAMLHHPAFGMLKNGGSDQVGSAKYGLPLFQSALDHGADIILNGDHHEFLATKKIDSQGNLATHGKSTREFIVGTGGAQVSVDNKTPKLKSNAIDAEIRNEVGVLKIELFAHNAELYFLTTQGVQYSTNVDC